MVILKIPSGFVKEIGLKRAIYEVNIQKANLFDTCSDEKPLEMPL
jgi:hypothetical protein